MARKVLVIEDNGALRFALQVMLENEPGVQRVATAPSGEAALRLAPDLDPDLVVADHGLPGISGADLARELRVSCPDAQIVSFSGSDTPAPWADYRIVKGTATALDELRAAVTRRPA
ncbi:MAG TPA: response regulator transcription factor [Actinomycetota bacterium]|nr:response regulator transcription factor [Actinomycetota bacterium]